MLFMLLVSSILVMVFSLGLVRFGVIFSSIGLCVLCWVLSCFCVLCRVLMKWWRVFFFCRLCRFWVLGEEMFMVM